MAKPEHLLAALLDACRSGRVAHCEAAKLLGIRKEDLGDLVAWRMVEVAVWRAYLSAFHRAFPECDQSLRYVPEWFPHVPQPRKPRPADCHTYGPGEAGSLPESQPHLFAPVANDAWQFAEPKNGNAWENGLRTFAPRDPREPARDTAGHLSPKAA